jgi:hypothetical protein
MPEAEEITRIIITEIHRQADARGFSTQDDGTLIQVDGSFDASQIAQAVLRGGQVKERPVTRLAFGGAAVEASPRIRFGRD